MSIRNILAEIECGFLFDTCTAEVHDDTRYIATVLRVGKRVPCNLHGDLSADDVQWGRPWLIHNNWSREKVQATALLACKLWLEHGLREQFAICDQPDGPSYPFYPNH